MKTLSYTLCAVLAAGFAFTGDAQVKPKSKKVTELKFSGRIQGQWDGIESDEVAEEDRNHFYFRRLFLGGHAKAWVTIGVVMCNGFRCFSKSG